VIDAATAFAAGAALFAVLFERFARLFEAVDKELLDSIQPLLTSAFKLSNSLRTPQ
jgi:hypothetical protein